MTSPEYIEACALIKEGYPIFPLHTARTLPDGISLCTCGESGCNGKHPRIAFSKEATTNREQIERWYNSNREPAYGIGIHLGKCYKWVLDIDGDEGMTELEDIVNTYGPLPDTRVVVSGSGKGRHYYFSGWVDRINSGSLSENIHIKGNVGSAYVVAPPTIHVSGKRYTYLNRCSPVDAPEWLITLANKKTLNCGSKLSLEQIESRNKFEVPITRLLTTEHLKKLHPEGNNLIRGTHPVHGSKNGRNFCIDQNINRWFCNREGHHSSGGLFEFAAMLAGICKCEDFTRANDGSITIPPLQGRKFKDAIKYCINAGIDAEDLKVHISGGKYART